MLPIAVIQLIDMSKVLQVLLCFCEQILHAVQESRIMLGNSQLMHNQARGVDNRMKTYAKAQHQLLQDDQGIVSAVTLDIKQWLLVRLYCSVSRWRAYTKGLRHSGAPSLYSSRSILAVDSRAGKVLHGWPRKPRPTCRVILGVET